MPNSVPSLSNPETDRLAAEIRRAEQRFRDVIEHNADGIVVVDAAGVIRFANATAAQLFGRTRDALQGSAFGFPVMAGETTELELVGFDEPRAVEMRVVGSNWEGEPAFIASLRDMTDRKNAERATLRLTQERAARESAELAVSRLSFLLKSSTVFSSSLDADAVLTALAKLCLRRIADWSVVYQFDAQGQLRRTAVFHRDAEKAELAEELQRIPIPSGTGHGAVRATRDFQSQLVTHVDDAIIAAATESPREREVIRALGVESFMLVPIAARGEVIAALGLACSSTTRRFGPDDLALAEDLALRAALAIENARLYEEARAANRSKADLLAVVSHDLRTPLNAIMGYSELLELGIPEPIGAGSLAHVNRIRTSAAHLLYLLNELLGFARLDAGGVTIRKTEVDVADVLRDVQSVMEPLAAARGLSLCVDAPPTGLRLHTDGDRLRQVLLNLVGNAVKYTRSGAVTVVIERRERALEIRVRDSGIGIAPEHLDRVFDPFWQVDATERAQRTGAGLGLSVVQRLVVLLGGRIAVKSALGKGSEFTVTLPADAR